MTHYDERISLNQTTEYCVILILFMFEKSPEVLEIIEKTIITIRNNEAPHRSVPMILYFKSIRLIIPLWGSNTYINK